MRLPRAVGAAERARRLGPRRGAGDRLGRRRGGEGACPAAGGRGVVPAARARRAARSCSGSARPPSPSASRGSPSGSRPSSSSRRPGCSSCASSARRRAGFPRRTGVAREASARLSAATSHAATRPARSADVAGRVYAFANQKGGVGKTTTAVNLAACLAEAGERALVVDLDPQANATSGLGDARERHLELRPARRRAARRARQADRVPEPLPRAVEAGARGRRGRALAARRTASASWPRRSPASDGFDFVLLDCPPSLGPLTVNALAAADRVIVPVQAEYYALEGLAQLMQSINLIKARLNPRLAVAGVLITMSDGRTKLAADVEARGAPALRRPRLRDRRAALRARCRGAEPRSAGHPLRPPLARRRGLLEGGDGACRAQLVRAPRPGPRLRSPDRRRRRRRARRTCRSSRSMRTRASRGALRPRGDRRPRRLDPHAGRRPAGRRPAARRGRLRADRRRAPLARRARGGMPTVPAVIREADDRDTLLLGLVENVARENLSAVEEARGYAVLMDEFELSLGDVSERVGRSKPAISNKMRLLELSDDVLAMVERGELTEGHARAVLAVPGPDGAAQAGTPDRRAGPLGACGRAGGRWSGARTKPRTKTAVDPALAARIKESLKTLTGREVACRAREGRAGLRRRARPRGARRGARAPDRPRLARLHSARRRRRTPICSAAGHSGSSRSCSPCSP